MLTSVDLFAGCGGLSRGLEAAGFECIAFNEINDDAAQSFQTNFEESYRVHGDIKEVLSRDGIRKEVIPIIGGDEIDLVCGGPPCQGFSGIGHRRSYTVEKGDIPTNDLYWDMIRVIEQIRPKAFLFENVAGLLSSRWDSSGETGEIWKEVYSAFSSYKWSGGPGYTTQPTLLHAYQFGVPQNRPRVFIMGIRDDIYPNCGFKATDYDIDTPQSKLTQTLRNNGGLFPHRTGSSTAPTIPDAISDLAYSDWNEGDRYRNPPESDYQEDMRRGLESPWEEQEVTDHRVSNHSRKVRDRFQMMIDENISNIRELPADLRTQKFSQKLLPRDWGGGNPTITCCSNSDDYVHYELPRALSVREWARLQSFPDHHLFCGPRTTGGVRRAGNPDEGVWTREVPKYTQIGNAVPPLVGEAIGRRISEILSTYNRQKVEASSSLQ